MKTMTCKQLGGACDIEFRAETFDEIANLSKQHGIEMYMSSDQDHLQAIEKVKELMQNPKAMQEWIDQKRKEFEALPEDK